MGFFSISDALSWLLKGEQAGCCRRSCCSVCGRCHSDDSEAARRGREEKHALLLAVRGALFTTFLLSSFLLSCSAAARRRQVSFRNCLILRSALAKPCFAFSPLLTLHRGRKSGVLRDADHHLTTKGKSQTRSRPPPTQPPTIRFVAAAWSCWSLPTLYYSSEASARRRPIRTPSPPHHPPAGRSRRGRALASWSSSSFALGTAPCATATRFTGARRP